MTTLVKTFFYRVALSAATAFVSAYVTKKTQEYLNRKGRRR
jgi:hypothetical protein